MKYTPKPPVPQLLPSYIIHPTSQAAFRYFQVCPDSQTLLAYSLTHQSLVLFPLPCKTWSCRTCAESKIKQLALAVQAAEPNRLLTLTIDPSLYLSPKEAWQKTRRCVPELIRKLRKQFGSIEYLRVTEVTRNGWPHYHLLVRSGYLPHSVVKACWSELTGAKIVDLRPVKKSFSAYMYLVKYLSKLHKLEWTERHVSLSRGFAPKEKWQPKVQIQTAEPDFIRIHPAYVVMERYPGCVITRISKNAHIITRHGDPPLDVRATCEEYLAETFCPENRSAADPPLKSPSEQPQDPRPDPPSPSCDF